MRCAYHSNSVGHDTEDCINLKHKIQDLIDQEVVSLQATTPNVNTNPLPNHGGSNVNMIETDEDWCRTKIITPIGKGFRFFKSQREERVCYFDTFNVCCLGAIRNSR